MRLSGMHTRLAVAAAVVVSVAAAAASAGAAPPLATSIYPTPYELSASPDIVFSRVQKAGAQWVRLQLDWSSISPPTRPAKPADPSIYDWRAIDTDVRLAVADGLKPYVMVVNAPAWARLRIPGVRASQVVGPDPAQLGLFARALATHFSGHTSAATLTSETGGPVPRVDYYEVWNEPNLSTYLAPQFVGGKPYSPGWYRQMLTAFSRSARAVNPHARIVVGGLAPFADPAVQKLAKDWGPMSFMRSLLCLSPSLRRTCATRVPFDVWAMHPYTSGDPSHKATLPNDVSLGNLPEMKSALDAAVRHHTILARNGVGFWVTEFSWDSSPPDRYAVPMSLLRQWVPAALYQMWKNGVTNVTWFTLRDGVGSSQIQAGLYYAGPTIQRDRPKPILQAFRFPFVAIPKGARTYVWGRTPDSAAHTVVIQEKLGYLGYRTVGVVHAGRNGIFQGYIGFSGGRGYLRAAIGSQKSLDYAVKRPKDHFYNPFGQEAGKAK